MFLSFFTPGSLKDVLPVIESLTRGPGRSLVRAGLLANAVLLLLGMVMAREQSTFFSTFVIVLATLLLAVTVLFAIRTYRLASRIDRWKEQRGATIVNPDTNDPRALPFDSPASTWHSAGQRASVIDEDGRPYSGPSSNPTDEEGARLKAEREQAARQAAQPRDTWMPGLDAAQRSAIAAAGGIVNAPYLKDDLRITVTAGLICALTLPVVFFFSIVSVLVLLF